MKARGRGVLNAQRRLGSDLNIHQFIVIISSEQCAEKRNKDKRNFFFYSYSAKLGMWAVKVQVL